MRKKRAIALKCAAVLFLAAVIFLLVFGIKSCIGAISQKRAENEERKQAEAQAELLAQAKDKPNASISPSGEIDNSFYKNSAFIGNSFVDGMEIYDFIGGADYFARIGLNVKDAMTLSEDSGSVAVIDELDRDKKYDKIFMMFGENELGWLSSESFKRDYAALISKARTYQPQAEIYLLAITPITKEVSKLNENGATKENVERFNELILEVAKEENVNFANIYNAVADENGYLPPEAASDGIHFNKEYYEKCLIYLQNAFKN